MEVANGLVPAERRLTAPAHITLVYPFIAPEAVTAQATAELTAFVRPVAPFSFELALGWFGREVLLLRPEPADAVVDLSQSWTTGGLVASSILRFGGAAPVASRQPQFVPLELRNFGRQDGCRGFASGAANVDRRPWRTGSQGPGEEPTWPPTPSSPTRGCS